MSQAHFLPSKSDDALVRTLVCAVGASPTKHLPSGALMHAGCAQGDKLMCTSCCGGDIHTCPVCKKTDVVNAPLQPVHGFVQQQLNLVPGTCSLCQVTMPFGQWEQHKLDSCRPLCKHGCGKKVALADTELHRAVCPEIVGHPCRYASDGCKFTGKKAALASHQDSCPFQPVACNFCDKVCVGREALAAHTKKDCQEVPVPCQYVADGCTDSYPRRLMPRHAGECKYRPMPCSGSRFKCDAILGKDARLAHEMNCPWAAMQQQQERMAQMEATIARLQAQQAAAALVFSSSTPAANSKASKKRKDQPIVSADEVSEASEHEKPAQGRCKLRRRMITSMEDLDDASQSSGSGEDDDADYEDDDDEQSKGGDDSAGDDESMTEVKKEVQKKKQTTQQFEAVIVPAKGNGLVIMRVVETGEMAVSFTTLGLRPFIRSEYWKNHEKPVGFIGQVTSPQCGGEYRFTTSLITEQLLRHIIQCAEQPEGERTSPYFIKSFDGLDLKPLRDALHKMTHNSARPSTSDDKTDTGIPVAFHFEQDHKTSGITSAVLHKKEIYMNVCISSLKHQLREDNLTRTILPSSGNTGRAKLSYSTRWRDGRFGMRPDVTVWSEAFVHALHHQCLQRGAAAASSSAAANQHPSVLKHADNVNAEAVEFMYKFACAAREQAVSQHLL